MEEMTDEVMRLEEINKQYYLGEAESIVRELKKSSFDLDYIDEKIRHIQELRFILANNRVRRAAGVFTGRIV